ncbi:DUF2218 domain-containing protein [Halomonas alkalicola]|uniref:DUF2218 domain-containing protein n=1 Tax=Halomonas alkalicola TaxID=1930622 RepID=A0ABY9H1F0_9GAMM|nr:MULTISPECIES: DUF2218 domain-containing protein [Halomonas]QJQ97278.1 DUF2218 domain-containing protein [Halomonas sp. PGE1]WLI71996.1 DUF2218 domain-containing protein [Halomonas alkalicola]
MPISRAEIPADDAEALIDQLCQRWSGEHAVAKRDAGVEVTFATGSCYLVAEPDKLVVVVEAVEDEAHDQLEGEVDNTLDALRGVELDIVWEA